MYNHKEIEKKWQDFWEQNKTFKTENGGEKLKYYVLDMFPYPSGAGLHVGHPKGYTANDIIARYKHAKGFNVLHPMGWDAFGLPAENYAIKTGTHPAITTKQNIDNMKKQIKSLGISYDWDREIDTTDPEYYKWTQWIFSKMFEAGLAYEQDLPINYCPSCKTGLSNEEVLSNGTCERCGTLVIKKKIRQWVLAITKYADRLAEDVDDLDWPEGIKEMQKSWIGRSEGCEFKMRMSENEGEFQRINSENFREGIQRIAENESREYGKEKRTKEEFGDKTVEIIGLAMKVQNELGGGLSEKIYQNGLKILLEKNGFKVEEEVKIEYKIDDINVGYGRIDLLVNGQIALELKSRKILEGDYYKQLRTYINQSKNIDTGLLLNFYNSKLEYKRLEKDYNYNKNILGNSQNNSQVFLSVYTTRIDTVFGMTYVVIAPDHKDIENFITPENREACNKYIEETKNKSDLDRTGINKDKTGVFTGSYVINPFNNEKIPVWIADYVLGNYGTGAVMAVPAHDERDFEFAKKYNLPIKQTVAENITCEVWTEAKCLVEDGILVNSGPFSGFTSVEARKKMVDFALENGFGERKVNYKLRDWLFSRQRYWGEPIPLIHIEKEDLNKLINLNFRDKTTIGTILNGSKLIETRAMNPEEKDRYFGNIKPSDCVIFTDLPNNARYLVKVKEIYNWANLEELFNDKDSLEKIFPYDGAHATLIDLKNRYGTFSHDYLGKAQRNGLFGFTFEIISKIYDGLYTSIIVDKNLPVKLPKVDKYEPSPDGQSPLARIESFVNVKLAENLNGKRETNTMPQWGGSCWYYLRYMDSKNEEALVGSEVEKYWGNVDSYVGGAEHAVLHLLYARFWHKFLSDIGVVSTKEPFARLRNQGLILAFAYRNKNGALISNDLVEERISENNKISSDNLSYYNKETGEELEKIVAKMSKSLKNIVNPDDIINEYGADSLRLYEMYLADFRDSAPWDTSKIIGVRRFLEKVWNLFENGKVGADDNEAIKLLHKTIKKVGEDVEEYKFNTAIASLMILVNYGTPKDEEMAKFWKENFLRILSLFAPHIAEELWQKLGHDKSIFFEEWPKYNERLVIDDKIEIGVQVLGKLRGSIQISKDELKEEVLAKAKINEGIKKWLEGKEIVKEIYVPGKIVNFVIK